MKKLFITIFILALVPLYAHAATAHLSTVPATVAQQQQFYVDVAVDAEGKSFNGVEGSIVFSSDTISFVRAETGTSNVTLFIDQPVAKGNTIHFSGVIPGGFDGAINPFDQRTKGPAQIVRLVFAGKAQGNAFIAARHFSVTGNDGNGTLETLHDQDTSFAVSGIVAPSVYQLSDVVAPTLTGQVVSDKELFDGKQALLFTATDKESGIDRVELQEGNGAWAAIESPYLLHDQSRHSILSLRAYDVAGNVATVRIAPEHSDHAVLLLIVLVLAVLSIIYVIYKKRIHYKKVS